MKLWIITWDTESGDRGVYPKAWKRKPSYKQQQKIMKDWSPDDFEAETIYWDLRQIEADV